ncbi:MAG TPA: UDP-N-acetylmuramate--L-alanine ligase [Candidatus Bathyarchaeia archaeon]|nr:UDP-N-acetylmuramate--L-alanine ligase [Candidatus Bathyarchaeia archaeon]
MAQYHFIGIGGIGMGKLASLLLSRGDQVTGSDLVESAMVQSLRNQGATVFIGHQADHLEGPDFVVYSSAVRPENPELMAAKQKGIPILKRAQLLAELMRPHHTVTVAGAHGKTTTTSMIAQLLIQAGFDPTVALGGVFQSSGTYQEISGAGHYFVAELDESDGSFLYFSPEISVVTNIDFEHVDYYQNWGNIIKAYRQFIGQTSVDGVVIGCGDDPRIREILKDRRGRSVLYGIGEQNDLAVRDMVFTGFGSHFLCVKGKEILGKVVLAVPGQHNICNSLATIAVGLELGISFSVICDTIAAYHGVKRRFELKGTWGETRVIDDYAHHPTEIRAVLQTAQRFYPKRLVAVFQPHRYSRLKFLKEEFVKSFSGVDQLIVTDVYAASESKIDEVADVDRLCGTIKLNSGCEAIYVPKSMLCDTVVGLIQEGDMIITLGAGDITKVSEGIAAALNERFSVNHG